jgi:hypothetical protein
MGHTVASVIGRPGGRAVGFRFSVGRETGVEVPERRLAAFRNTRPGNFQIELFANNRLFPLETFEHLAMTSYNEEKAEACILKPLVEEVLLSLQLPRATANRPPRHARRGLTVPRVLAAGRHVSFSASRQVPIVDRLRVRLPIRRGRRRRVRRGMGPTRYTAFYRT